MDKPVTRQAKKRSAVVEENDKARSTRSRASQKRRRVSPEKNEKKALEKQKQEEEPIPMEIDSEPATTLYATEEAPAPPRVVGTRRSTRGSPAAAGTNGFSSSPRRISITYNASPQQVEEPSSPGRMDTPTALQVTRRLPDSKHKKKDALKTPTYPKAPPHSPFAVGQDALIPKDISRTPLAIITEKKETTKKKELNSTLASTARRRFPRAVPILLGLLSLLFLTGVTSWMALPRSKPDRLFAHIVPPSYITNNRPQEQYLSNITLRQFLTHDDGIHLAMAPAFFGFYAYFGALAAWNQALSTTKSSAVENGNATDLQEENELSFLKQSIKSVAGGSAGAMAAVLIAAGIDPLRAADYVGTMTLSKFADPPGLFAAFKGQVFEELMKDFIVSQTMRELQLQNAEIPVAVSAFDVKTLSGKILQTGSMARAARASATFPFLFQPVQWIHEKDDSNDQEVSYFIDGGIFDRWGLEGLSVLVPNEPKKRIVNVVVGGFGTFPPKELPKGVDEAASEVLYISIQNTPICGPWAMANGPRALQASLQAMEASMDLPLYKGKEPGQYELHIDTSSFVPTN